TVTVSASVTVEVKNVISGSSVHLATIDGNGDESTVILNEVASGTTASTAINFSGLDYTAVTIAVRKSSGTPRYLPYRSSDTISASGLSHSANQQEDNLAS
ncbi:MAG: hypothetical protein U9N61_10025, partial [Euryarchaeota archaeon]|nr:hypothetical protein [Euryarchaeota archaeon]